MDHPISTERFDSRQLLDQISDKWTPIILGALCARPLRFNHLRRDLDGITQTALTNCLRRLERNGILARNVVSSRPIAVEYAITPLGRTLEPIFSMLESWTRTHLDAVETARADFAEGNWPRRNRALQDALEVLAVELDFAILARSGCASGRRPVATRGAWPRRRAAANHGA